MKWKYDRTSFMGSIERVENDYVTFLKDIHNPKHLVTRIVSTSAFVTVGDGISRSYTLIVTYKQRKKLFGIF